MRKKEEGKLYFDVVSFFISLLIWNKQQLKAVLLAFYDTVNGRLTTLAYFPALY